MSAPIRTIVYVDSFNLYFGCLKGTAYRWLDLAELCRRSLPPEYQVNHIHFFTARVRARPNDSQQPLRQQTYIRALETIPYLTVQYGTFLQSTVRAPLAKPVPGGPMFADVLKTEEKGSDVNIATQLLVDAFDHAFDAAVVVSDDSDLVQPVHVVRKKFGRHVRVLSPRGKSRELYKVATRFQKIEVSALQTSQFPQTLTDKNGIITKPATW